MIWVSHLCVAGLKQEEIRSPILFSLFIHELAKEIMQRGRHGIQLILDLIQIFTLLFADLGFWYCKWELIDKSNWLTKAIDCVFDSANRLSIFVNMNKLKIVVFRNGGPKNVKNGNVATPQWKLWICTSIWGYIFLHGFSYSPGAVWESRWPSWAVRPNEPSGFRGRKAISNHASALVSACP